MFKNEHKYKNPLTKYMTKINIHNIYNSLIIIHNFIKKIIIHNKNQVKDNTGFEINQTRYKNNED